MEYFDKILYTLIIIIIIIISLFKEDYILSKTYLSNIWSSVKLTLHKKHKHYVQYLQLNNVYNISRNIFNVDIV